MSISASAQDHYVSPRGDDRGPGTEARPWKTLGHALKSVQELQGDVRIMVMDGEYPLEETLVIEGVSGRKVSLEAAPGASPVIRGDRKVLRFRPWKDNILRADLKASGIRNFGNACMTLKESILEDEGMHVFEWWGGEYRPLEELIAEMDEVKKNNK